MISKKAFFILVLSLGFCFHINVNASQVYLSDYLGVQSGEIAYSGDGVYSTVSTYTRGFGADIAGGWVNDPNDTISFLNGGTETTYEKGIGAHPAQNGETRIDFNLDEFRNDGFTISRFYAVVGVDYFSGGQYGSSTNGANFLVYVDDVLVANRAVRGVNNGSFLIDVVLTDDNHELSLATTSIGFYGSHAAWGDAQLNVSAIAEPSIISLMGLAMIGMVSFRKNRE